MIRDRVKKLDRRHTGYGHFKFYVVTYGSIEDRLHRLQQWREWCWSQFGPGAERDTILKIPNGQWKWGWQNDQNGCRLYFVDDAELFWFTLTWL